MVDPPRKTRLMKLICLVAVVAVTSSCTTKTQSRGDEVADWVRSQPHVSDASASVDPLPYDHELTMAVTVDVDVSDDELVALVEDADHRAEDAGWMNPQITFSVGPRRSVSNLGGPVTVAIFNGLRHDSHYEFAIARGTGSCASNFCVGIAEDDPAALLGEVKHMLHLADAAGGVQPNLDFSAADPSGDFIVEAQPDAPVDEAVALWRRIAVDQPLTGASAYSIEPVGDIPASQALTVTVVTALQKTAVERIASEQSRVDVLVHATETDRI